METEVLYAFDATDLKRADRSRRVFWLLITSIAQLAPILVLWIFLNMWAIVVYALISYLFLPIPIAPAPRRYEITNEGVRTNSRDTFVFNEFHSIDLNSQRRFVSIRRRHKGEVLRLYTPDLDKVMNALGELKSRVPHPV